jgi:hypothetical protein
MSQKKDEPLRSNRIDLIDEDDTRRVLLRHPKQLPHQLGTISEVLLDELGPDDSEEGGGCLVRDGFSEEGLSGSGDTVEDNTFWRADAHLLVELGVGEGEFDGFLSRRTGRGREERQGTCWLKEGRKEERVVKCKAEWKRCGGWERVIREQVEGNKKSAESLFAASVVQTPGNEQKTNLDLLNLALQPTHIGITLRRRLVELHHIHHRVRIVAQHPHDRIALVMQQHTATRLQQVLVNERHDGDVVFGPGGGGDDGVVVIDDLFERADGHRRAPKFVDGRALFRRF